MKNKLKVLSIVLSLVFGSVIFESVIPNVVRDLSVNGRGGYAFAEGTFSQDDDEPQLLTFPAPTDTDSESAETSDDSSGNPIINKGGFHVINPAWENNKKAENIQQVTAIGQQIAQSGSGFTKDPKTNSYIAAAGSSIGATGALIGSAYHLNRAGTYGDASRINSEAAVETQDKINEQHQDAQKISNVMAQLDVMAQLEQQKSRLYANSNNRAVAIAAAAIAAIDAHKAKLKVNLAVIEANKKKLSAKLTAQEALAGDQTFSQVGSYLLGGLGIISSAAMAGTGVMQLEQGRQLASDNDYCAKHPNEFPRCTEVVPQGDNSPINPLDQNPPTSLNDPGFSGFERSGADEDNLSPASASAAGLNASPASAAGPSFGAGLSGGRGEDRNPAKEKEELDDIGGKGFSGDQTYEGGGGNIDQLGSGSMASSLIAPPFDISQFLPANLREDEFGPYAAKINDKEKEEQKMVLGKESPSLFTRISKAYQKRAHEMLKGVI